VFALPHPLSLSSTPPPPPPVSRRRHHRHTPRAQSLITTRAPSISTFARPVIHIIHVPSSSVRGVRPCDRRETQHTRAHTHAHAHTHARTHLVDDSRIERNRASSPPVVVVVLDRHPRSTSRSHSLHTTRRTTTTTPPHSPIHLLIYIAPPPSRLADRRVDRQDSRGIGFVLTGRPRIDRSRGRARAVDRWMGED